MMAWLRLAAALTLFAIATILLLPLQIAAVKFGWTWQRPLAVRFHRLMAALLGIRVHVSGAIARERPLMLVANHVSWTDIIVLGSIGYVSFIAKNEVKGWPLFGTFAELQHTVFVDREAKRRSGDQAGEIARRIAEGDPMVLFPEGTTGDGNRLLPFKSSLFGAARMVVEAAHADKVHIQPVSLSYVRVHGMPMGRVHRRIISYVGDEAMQTSLALLLKGTAIDVDVRFAAPLSFTAQTDRKAFARRIEGIIGEMVTAGNSMRRSSHDPVANGAADR
jgi:1-acyl-sn-glycerol-3-phosphate acyltransferase